MSEVKWKEFRIGDLFELIPTKKLPYKASECAKEPAEDYLLPVLTAGIENQGLSGYIPYDGATVLKDCVSVSANGANTGSMFYQDEDFTVLQDAYAIKLKNYEGNREVYLFLISCMQKVIKGNFDWSNKAKWMRVKDLLISLPVTSSGNPDFAYMEKRISELEEERISELEEERISELEAYLTASGLDDYELTDEDKKILNEMENGEKEFGKFRIGDLFEICTPKKKFNANTVKFGGKYPYVVRTSSSNGIRGYITEDTNFLNPANTISFGQDTATMFYQDSPYFTGDKIKIMKLKKEILNRRTANFLISAMSKSFVNFAWGQTSFSEKVLNNVEFDLPITSSGAPDYEWMERYIRATEKEVIGKLYEYRGKEIDAAKETVQIPYSFSDD